MTSSFALNDMVIKNEEYRSIVYNASGMEMTVMNVHINDEIPEEVHTRETQFSMVVSGTCMVIISGIEVYTVGQGDCIFIPPNTKHRFVNTGTKDLKLFTIYTCIAGPEDL
jgi:mannose-6-phosphate isomerase-like protein (cupin superfamily)